MAELPAFVQFPPSNLQTQIAPVEWEQSLDAWIVLSESLLALSDDQFEQISRNGEQGVISFVTSYVHEHGEQESGLLDSEKSLDLHKIVYLLVHRLLSFQSPNQSLLDWNFLSGVCLLFGQTSSLQNLLSNVYEHHSSLIKPQLEAVKRELVQDVDKNQIQASKFTLLSQLIRFLPDVGQFFAAGSDLSDGLIRLYPKLDLESQRSTVIFFYFMLLSLLKLKRSNQSLLSTHLYALKTDAQSNQLSENSSLLSTIVSDTDFLKQVDILSNPEVGVTPDYNAGLLEFQVKRPRRHKGKGKTKANTAMEADDVHIHQMTLITQIQDLFPELGSGFVSKLLDYYDEDVTKVTEHLLDDSLPPSLASMDHSEELGSNSNQKSIVPSRRNIYDDDDLDNLSVSTAKLHIGKAEDDGAASSNLKAHIYAALEAFDSNDDERDDTYDDADHVGGSIDASSGAPTAETSTKDEAAERILFEIWKSNPSELTRSMRFTSRRKELKTKTGLTDEAIEGFAIMMGRDSSREKTFQQRFADQEWQGEQKVIERTAWRDEGSGEEQSDGNINRGGRGRGGFRGGRGGAPQSSTGDSQRARRNKEVRGNQRRREGRARKTRGAMA